MSSLLDNDQAISLDENILNCELSKTITYKNFKILFFNYRLNNVLIENHVGFDLKQLFIFKAENLKFYKHNSSSWVLLIPDALQNFAYEIAISHIDTITNIKSNDDRSFEVVLEYLNAFNDSTYGLEILDHNFKLVKHNVIRSKQLTLSKTVFDILREFEGEHYLDSKIDDLKKGKVVFFRSLYFKESKSHFKFSTTPVMSAKNEVSYFVNFIENITLQKEIENNLLSTNMVMDEGLLIHQNLSIIYANKALVKLTGYDELEHIKNKNIFDFIAPDYHELVNEKISSKKIEKYQIIGIKKDGTRFPLEIKSVLNDFNDVNTRTVSIRDISDLKENLDQLKQKNNKLNFIYDNISDVISIHSFDSAVLYATPSLLNLTGYTLSQVKGHKAFERIEKDYYENIKNSISDLFKNKNPITIRYKFKHAKGHYLWLESNINFINYNEEGLESNKAFLCVTKNIEKEIKKENDLKHEFSLLNLLCEISKNFIEYDFDQHQTIIQKSLNLIGKYAKSDRAYIIDFDFKNHTLSNTYEWVNNGVSEEIDNTKNIDLDSIPAITDKLYNGEIFSITNINDLANSYLKSILIDQNIQSILNIPLMLNNECIGIVGFDQVNSVRNFQDYEIDLLIIYAQMLVNFRERDKVVKSLVDKNNELNDAHHHLKLVNSRLNTALEKANKSQELEKSLLDLRINQESILVREKLASIGVLTAGVAHEINNPLNFIKGGIIALENFIEDKSENLKKETDPYFEMINSGIKRTTKIVKSLNRFNRSNTQMNELCDINLIIDNCIVILNNKLKHKIEIIKSFSDDVIIKGNEGQLHQMFTNILSNSEQAITDKGYIKITTKTYDKKVFISIKDSGIGINKAQINRIFEPFYTTKEPGKGTGLGLAIVYNIIKEHKGNIDIKSKQNIGTNLEITFNKVNNGI